MLIGSHISAAGGVANAPKNAAKVGAEVFQFFSRSPQGGPAPELTAEIIKKFKANCKRAKQKEWYIHAPYYINLASTNNRIRHGSISVLRKELERGTALGAKYMMAHMGSARDVGETKGIKMVIEGINKILDGYRGSCRFLVEISAGSGAVIGDEFAEIGKIIKGAKKPVGVCFDTCHAFASGYDLRNRARLNKTLKEFEKFIGLDKLKLIHANDSKTDLGSHRDRHEHIGQGKIGSQGFWEILHHPKLKNVNIIIETPKCTGKDDAKNIKVLKKLRAQQSL
jgi:deoxyribonuclease-4